MNVFILVHSGTVGFSSDLQANIICLFSNVNKVTKYLREHKIFLYNTEEDLF